MPLLPDHGNHVNAVAHQRVQLHAGEAECAVAEQQHDLAAGMRELGGQRVARPASPGSRTGPGPASPRLVDCRPPARRRRPKSPPSTMTIASRSSTCGRARRTRASGAVARGRRRVRPRSAARLLRSRPRAADRSTLVCRRASRSASADSDRRQSRRRARPRPRAGCAALGLGDVGDDDLASPRRTRRRSRAGSPSARRSRARRRPPLSAAERAREKASSWSAGRQPRARPLRNTGMPQPPPPASRSASSPCAPVQLGAGHDHRPLGVAQQRDRAVERARVAVRAPASVGAPAGASVLAPP